MLYLRDAHIPVVTRAHFLKVIEHFTYYYPTSEPTMIIHQVEHIIHFHTGADRDRLLKK